MNNDAMPGFGMIPVRVYNDDPKVTQNFIKMLRETCADLLRERDEARRWARYFMFKRDNWHANYNSMKRERDMYRADVETLTKELELKRAEVERLKATANQEGAG